MRRLVLRAVLAALCAASLAGCIDSADPIFADSQEAFGPRLKLVLYSLRDGYAHDPNPAEFAWNGHLYARASGGLKEVTAFSMRSFEAGDYIIQTVPPRRGDTTEYALLHKLAEGVYQVLPIDEGDADEQTRAAYCKRADKSGCRVETREQVLAFARFTQAQRRADGGLVIRLPDRPEKKARAQRK